MLSDHLSKSFLLVNHLFLRFILNRVYNKISCKRKREPHLFQTFTKSITNKTENNTKRVVDTLQKQSSGDVL